MLARSPRPAAALSADDIRRLMPAVPESPEARAAEIELAEARAEREGLVQRMTALQARARASDRSAPEITDEIDALAIRLRQVERRVVAARGPVDRHRAARRIEEERMARHILRPVAARAARDALPALAAVAAEIAKIAAATQILVAAGAAGRGDTPMLNLARPLEHLERGLRAWAETT